MNYRTADSYKNAKWICEPYEINGKMYVNIEKECDRCVKGVYAVGVENGHIKPHPAFNGVCLKCGGTGVLRKDKVRLYTEEEYERNKRNQERARQRREEEREVEMLKAAAVKKEKWLETNGFNENEETYIVFGDSYSIKDELKDAGWKFSHQFLWHKPDPAGYEDRVIKLNINEIIDYWYPSGLPAFKENANQIIKDKLNESLPHSESIYYEEDVFKDMLVTLVRKTGFYGAYGWTNIYTFKSEENYVFVWFTSTEQDIEQGDSCFISGKVKERKTYNNEAQTIVTRVKIS